MSTTLQNHQSKTGKRGRPAREGVSAGDNLRMRMTRERKAAWEAAAAREGLTLSQWITQACDGVAKYRPRPGSPEIGAGA